MRFAVPAGLAQFYNKVFCHSWDTPEVYCAAFPQLNGLRFGCALVTRTQAVQPVDLTTL